MTKQVFYVFELLAKHHAREAFFCGVEALDRYLQLYARQEMKKCFATTKRCVRSSREVASTAIIVDAKNDQATNFYKHFGFVQFLEDEHKLFLPLASATKLFCINKKAH